MFEKLKAALANALNLGEAEAHQLVTALETDLAPMLAQFKTELAAEVKTVVTEGQADAGKLAALVAAEVAKLLAETKPAA